MTTRNACIAAALLAAACTAQGQRSDLSIEKVVPPIFTAATATSGPSCAFDTSTEEVSYLALNPAENLGNVAAVVQNNIQDPSSLNPLFRLNTATFQPHQAVVNYEVIGTGTAPATPNIIPVSSGEVPAGAKGTIAVPLFAGSTMTVSAGSFVRVTFRIEGKLQDNSKVSTNEREYVFVICGTAGCGSGGAWGTCL